MVADAEIALLALAAALYLYDCTVLLGVDEFVLERRRGAGWRPRFGAIGWTLRGKEPLLLNPLMPWRAAARVRWKPEQAATVFGQNGPAGSAGATLHLMVPRVARVGVGVLLLLVFAALPMAFAVRGGALPMLAVIGAVYASVIVVLASLRRAWLAAGLTRKAFMALCVECLSCPPFSVNAVRRFSLAALPALDLTKALACAERDGGTPALEALRRELGLRVAAQIDAEPEGSERMRELERVARALQPAAETP